MLALFAPVAQWLEQLTHNQLAVGSSPTGRTYFTIHNMLKQKPHPYLYAGLDKFSQKLIRSYTHIDRDELHIIADVCCAVYDITPTEFRSSRRYRQFADARKAFYYICREELYEFTCERLGMYTEKNHSTVVIAMQQTRKLLKTDSNFRAKYNTIRRNAEVELHRKGYAWKGST